MTLPSPFPSFVLFESAGPADVDGFELWPEEASHLGPRVHESRRLHFTLGRLAARRALTRLLGSPPPVPRADDGRPLWPRGVVGAITHTGEVGAAAVARATDCRGLGLDIEQWTRRLTTDITDKVCRPEERPWVQEAAGDEARARLIMVFAAKEAVFKALYPLERVWFGFHDAALRWDEAARAFTAELKRPVAADWPAGSTLPVRCEVAGELVIAAAVARR